MKNILPILVIYGVVFSSCNKVNTETGHIADAKFTQAHLSLSDSLINLPVSSHDSITTIKVPSDLDNPNYFVEFSKVIEDIEYVPLETTEGSIINSIESAMVYQDKIYILDMFGKSILVFYKNGDFIKRIGKSGKGPREYIAPVAIDIDQVNQLLYILDDRASKFLIFDLQGNFVREEQVNYRLNDFEILNDSTYVVNTDTRTNFHLPAIANHKLVFTDKKWKIFAKGLEYDATNTSELSFSRSGLYKYKDQVVYNPTTSYQIFAVVEDGLDPKYFIDAGTAMLPKNFDYKLSIDDFLINYDNLESPFMYINGPILETEDYLVTSLRHRHRNVHFFYSKRSGQLFFGKHYRFEPYKHTITPPIKGIDDSGKFYGYINAVQFKSEADFIERNNVGKIHPALKSIPAENNPIFVFYKLKSF